MPAIIEKMCLLLFQDICFVRKSTWGPGGGGWMLLDSSAQSWSRTHLKFKIKTLAHLTYWWSRYRDQLQINAFSMHYCSRVWLTFGRVGVEIFTPTDFLEPYKPAVQDVQPLPSVVMQQKPVQAIPPLHSVLSPDWIKWAAIPENVFSLSMREPGGGGETRVTKQTLINSDYL